MSEELARCPKCGSFGIYVNKDGRYSKGRKTKYISCGVTSCMPFEEIYTIEEWHNGCKPVDSDEVIYLRAQLAAKDAEIKQLLDAEWNIITKNEDCPDSPGIYEVISDCDSAVETVSYSVIDGWDTHHWVAAWRRVQR